LFSIVDEVASGAVARSNNLPQRLLPEALRGLAHRRRGRHRPCPAPNRSPPTILRSTFSYASPKNNANAPRTERRRRAELLLPGGCILALLPRHTVVTVQGSVDSCDRVLSRV
jgi:hypothetical protein